MTRSKFKSIEVQPHFKPRTVRSPDGENWEVPEGWVLLEPGDPGLTRRVKAAGPSWTVKQKKGRKMFSKGVWAPEDIIKAQRLKLETERAHPSYQRKLEQARLRREKEQARYKKEFAYHVSTFLNFDSKFIDLENLMSAAVTEHAVPVGSGTVARTKRIPVQERAEAAVIAWMRHQTTAYDHMKIPRVKGARRKVRGMLAQRSRELLDDYRVGRDVDTGTCPLATALLSER